MIRSGHKSLNLMTWFPFVMLVVLWIITVFFWQLAHKRTADLAYTKLEQQANILTWHIRNRIEIYAAALYGMQGFIAESDIMNRSKWRGYVQAADIANRFPGASSFFYAPRVTFENKDSFERRIRQDRSVNPEGHPTFTIYPLNETQTEYFPVTYVEPRTTEFERTLGLNLGRSESRKTAIESARDSGKAVSTGKITLASTEESGFMIFAPMYEKEAPNDTTENRQKSFTGVVAVVFRPEDFFPAMLAETNQTSLDFAIFDSRTDQMLSSDQLLYEYSQTINQQTPSQMVLTKPLTINDHVWQLQFSAPKDWGLSRLEKLLPRLILFNGLNVSTILFLLLYRHSRMQKHALALANEMIEQLRQHDKLHSHTRVEQFRKKRV